MARSEFVQALRKARAVCNPPRADHFNHAMRVLRHILLRANRAVPGVADGRIRYHIHDGAGVFARIG